jgi:aspartate/methionine/tyrosine aminotransferase
VLQYPLQAQNQYLPDVEAIAQLTQNQNVKLMWVNYPHMPTGASGSQQTFTQLANLAMRHQFILANDNPYGLLQAGKPLSLLSGLDLNQAPCVELNSLSKSFNMAGWRVGMLCGNVDILQQTLKVKSNVDSGMFKPVQLGAIEALEADTTWFLSLQQTYAQRRLLAAQLFDVLQCHYMPGQQGMFLWAQIPDKWASGEQLVEHLLQKAGVFITPGFIFGSEGERYVRVSLCATPTQFEKAKACIEGVL